MKMGLSEKVYGEAVERIGDTAEEYWKEGYCCSEAMVLAARSPSACSPTTPARSNRACHVKELSARFRERMEQEAGGHVCADLLARMGDANHDKRLCGMLTRRGAEVLGELIVG